MERQAKLAAVFVMTLSLLGCGHTNSGLDTRSRDVLQVKRLEFVDPDGRIRASLGVESAGVALRMFDRAGRPALVLEVKNDSPRDRALLTFLDGDAKASAALGYSSFVLSAPDVVWGNKMPMLAFFGAEEKVSWHAPPDIVGPWNEARFVH